MLFAMIGGTNIEKPPYPYREETVETPYGAVILFRCRLENGTETVFLSRHGVQQYFDPPDINFRANVFALHAVGVTHALGVTSVGACDYSYKLGTLCLMADFLDFTRLRPTSFERKYRKSLHTGMEDVFDPGLNDALERLIVHKGVPYSGRAIYACTEGPRFQTSAEIRALRMLGAQVSGMTLVPEAPLCRDLGITYAALGIISNHCTGMTSYVTDDGIEAVMSGIRTQVFDLFSELVTQMK